MHDGGLHIDGTMPRGRDLGVAGDAERGGISADPNDDGHGQKSRRCGLASRPSRQVSGFAMLHVWQAKADGVWSHDAWLCRETCKSSIWGQGRLEPAEGQRADLLPNFATLGNPRRSTDNCMGCSGGAILTL